MSTSSRRHTLAVGAAAAFLLSSFSASGASAYAPVKGSEVAPVAQGNVTFDCLLLPFQSAFRYEGQVSVAGPRDFEPGTTVELVGKFPKLPGIAPVPIENGKMRVSATGTVGGQEMELRATHTVNSEANAEVVMPRLTGQVQLDDADAQIQLTGFNFAFDEMMNINITADCEATKGGVIGAMASASGASADGGDSETKAAAGDEEGMPAIVLGGGALAVVAAGLLFWFSRRARRA